MKTFFVIVLVALVAMTAVEAQFGRGGGRPGGARGGGGGRGGGGRRGGGRGGPSSESSSSESLVKSSASQDTKSREGDRHDKEGFNRPVACKITNSTDVVMEKACRNEITCGSNAAVQFTSGSETYNVFFCDIPFPTLKMACNVTEAAEGFEHSDLMTCDDCSVGPHVTMDPCNNTVTYYTCAGMPTQFNYTGAFLKRACEVNGVEQRKCKRNKPCDGVVLNVDSISAKYCQSTTDEGFNWMDLFGKSRDGNRKGRKGQRKGWGKRKGRKNSSEESEEEIKCQPRMRMTTASNIP